MCALAGVSRAGYYRHWRETAPGQEETALRDRVQQLALENPQYGYRRVLALLKREGWAVNHKRVLRLMREDNLLCLRQRRFIPATTDSRHRFRVYPNLARNLELTAINQLWVADLTYVRLGEGFVYLAVVLDAFSRRVVGWAMEDHLEASLATAALRQALARRDVIPGGLIHHSDRGMQYAGSEYMEILAEYKIQPSMSRAGCPYDNAMVESFMKTLKYEQVNAQTYRTLDHAKADIGAFIETVYNRQRLHSALAYATPEEFENQIRQTAP